MKATDDLRHMVAGRLVEDPRAVLDAPALRIIRPEVEPPDPRKGDRLGAHGTRFEGDIEIAVGQPRFAARVGGRPDRKYFRVRGGIRILFDPVSRRRQDPRRGPLDDHRAHGHVAGVSRRARGREGRVHMVCTTHGPDGARAEPKLQRRARAA